MAGVAVGPSQQYWSKDGVHDNSCNYICRQSRDVGYSIRLPDFILANEIDIFSHKGRKVSYLADVARLEEEVLVGPEFIGPISCQISTTSKRKRGHAGVTGTEGRPPGSR
jgi:hypothetical protein